jgi:hypothetical protein
MNTSRHVWCGRTTRDLALTVAALLVAALPVSAQSAIDTTLAREYVTEVRALAERTDTLWKVRTLGALLFVDPRTRQVVASQADSAGLLSALGELFVGTLPAALPIANTAVTLGGTRYAMLMWPLPVDRGARVRLLLHESFHRVQDQLGLPAANPSNAHLNTTAARIWTSLEWRALAEALLRDGTQRVQLLSDALAFRAMRLRLDQQAGEDEQALLLNEGLAEYNGWASSGEADSLLARRVALAMLSRERQESLVRSFAYASGPAYGVLLDGSGMAWRSQLNANSDLAELLRAAYPAVRVDTTRMLQRSERHGGLLIRAEETEMAARRAETERGHRARLVEQPVVRLPATDSLSYSFNPNDAFPLAGIGTVYSTGQFTDVWGTLRVARNGVLLKQRAGVPGEVVVPGPAAGRSALSNGNWTLTLAPGWTLREGTRPGDWVVGRQ